MSRDDCILIFKLSSGHMSKLNIYVVVRVQAHENFKSKSYVKWFLSKDEPYKFTNNFWKAIYLANSMNKSNTEYGIKIADTKLTLNDVEASITDGKLIFDSPHDIPDGTEKEDDEIQLQDFAYKKKTKGNVRPNKHVSPKGVTYSSIVSSLTNKVDVNTQILNCLKQLSDSVENLSKVLTKNPELNK